MEIFVTSAPRIDDQGVRDEPATAAHANYEIAFDSVNRVVRARTLGFLSSTEADEYVARLRSELELCRSVTGRRTLIVNTMGCPVQTPDVASRLSYLGEALAAGDRAALIVESSLIRMQVRRLIDKDAVEIFISETAAETWLSAA